jgi:hypothetical protein
MDEQTAVDRPWLLALGAYGDENGALVFENERRKLRVYFGDAKLSTEELFLSITPDMSRSKFLELLASMGFSWSDPCHDCKLRW